jgi:hypothetical protein
MKPYIHTEKTDPTCSSYFGLMADISYYASRVAIYAAKCDALAYEHHPEHSSRPTFEQMLQLNIERVNKCLAALLALETASVQQKEAAE